MRAADATGKAGLLLLGSLRRSFTHPGEGLVGAWKAAVDPLVHPGRNLRDLGRGIRQHPLMGTVDALQFGAGVVSTSTLGASLVLLAAAPFTGGATLPMLDHVMHVMGDAGMVSLGASGVQLAGHEVEAARAETREQLSKAEGLIAGDMLNLTIGIATLNAGDHIVRATGVGQELLTAHQDALLEHNPDVDAALDRMHITRRTGRVVDRMREFARKLHLHA